MIFIAKTCAGHCKTTSRSGTGSRAAVQFIMAASLEDAFGRAMRDQIPYVIVFASKDVEDGTCTFRALKKTGHKILGNSNGVIPLCEDF